MELSIGAKIGVGILGAVFALIAVVLVGTGLPHVSIVPGFIAGICLSVIIVPPIAEMLVGIVNPSNVADPPEEFTAIRAMMARHEYDEAAAELRQVLAERPGLPPASALLIKVLYEHQNRPADALPVALEALERATGWHEALERITMTATDMALELQRPDLARQALARGIQLCGNAGPVAASFQSRLQNL